MDYDYSIEVIGTGTYMKNFLINFTLLLFVSFYLTGCEEQRQIEADNTDTERPTDFYSMNNVKVGNITGNSILMRTPAGDLATTTAMNTPAMVHEGLGPSHVRGARIYDDFTIELGAVVPGPNLILDIVDVGATPVSPDLAAADSWRCSHCHGFDYEGGVYSFNNGATNNLLELRDVRGRTEDDVIHMLMNGFDAWDPNIGAVVNVHNYTDLLTPQAMVDVSDFVVNEIYDTHIYIRAPSSGGLGDVTEGQAMYDSTTTTGIPAFIRVDGTNFNCLDCHGADGLMVTGIDLNLLSWTEPFRWLHRVNFGSPRDLATFPDITAEDATVHPGLYEIILTDGLHFGGPEQAANLMAHIQSDPTFAPAVDPAPGTPAPADPAPADPAPANPAPAGS